MTITTYSRTDGATTCLVFSWMFTIAYCLVVALEVGLGSWLDLVFYWQVVMHTYLCDLGCNCHVPLQHRSDATELCFAAAVAKIQKNTFLRFCMSFCNCLLDNSPTSQLAVSQVADGLDDSRTKSDFKKKYIQSDYLLFRILRQTFRRVV